MVKSYNEIQEKINKAKERKLKELEEQKNEINEQTEEIDEQNKEIEEDTDEIEKDTDDLEDNNNHKHSHNSGHVNFGSLFIILLIGTLLILLTFFRKFFTSRLGLIITAGIIIGFLIISKTLDKLNVGGGSNSLKYILHGLIIIAIIASIFIFGIDRSLIFLNLYLFLILLNKIFKAIGGDRSFLEYVFFVLFFGLALLRFMSILSTKQTLFIYGILLLILIVYFTINKLGKGKGFSFGSGSGLIVLIVLLVLLVILSYFGIFNLIPFKYILIGIGVIILLLVLSWFIGSKRKNGLNIQVGGKHINFMLILIAMILLAVGIFYAGNRFFGLTLSNPFFLGGSIAALILFFLLLISNGKNSVSFILFKFLLFLFIVAAIIIAGVYFSKYVPGKTFSEKFDYAMTYLSESDVNELDFGKRWWDKQISMATGDYYTGQVDEYADKKIGVYISELETVKQHYYEDEDIMVWATLEAYLLEDFKMPIELKCTMGENITGQMEPESLELFTDRSRRVSCNFPANVVKKGSQVIKIEATFELTTMAYLTTYFMEGEKYEELTMELKSQDQDIFDYYKIKDKNPVAKYNNGPIKYGLETEKPPVLIYPDRNYKPFLGVSLDPNNVWGSGSLKKINNIDIYLPREIKLLTCNDQFYDIGPSDNEIGENFITYQYNPKDSNEKDAEKITSFNCRMEVSKSIVKDNPFVARAIKSSANYVYQVQDSMIVQVSELKTSNSDNSDDNDNSQKEVKKDDSNNNNDNNNQNNDSSTQENHDSEDSFCSNIKSCTYYIKTMCNNDICKVGPCIWDGRDCIEERSIE